MTSTNKPPVRTPSRDRVFDVIDGECEYLGDHNESLFDQPGNEGDTLIALAQMVRAAQMNHTAEPAGKIETINRLRGIAAVAVMALEKFGPIPREYHVPASANITAEMALRDRGDALALNKPRPRP